MGDHRTAQQGSSNGHSPKHHVGPQPDQYQFTIIKGIKRRMTMKSESRYAKLIVTGLCCLLLLALPGVTARGRTTTSPSHLDEANALIPILNKNTNLYDDDNIS